MERKPKAGLEAIEVNRRTLIKGLVGRLVLLRRPQEHIIWDLVQPPEASNLEGRDQAPKF